MITEGGMGLLYFKGEKFGNCTFRVVFNFEPNPNSGFYLRIPERPVEPWMPHNTGYDVHFGERTSGFLYGYTKPPKNPLNWHTMEITLDGQRTAVVLNGEPVAEHRGSDPAPPRTGWTIPFRGPRPDCGYIGLQNHGWGETTDVREVSVRQNR